MLTDLARSSPLLNPSGLEDVASPPFVWESLSTNLRRRCRLMRLCYSEWACQSLWFQCHHLLGHTHTYSKQHQSQILTLSQIILSIKIGPRILNQFCDRNQVEGIIKDKKTKINVSMSQWSKIQQMNPNERSFMQWPECEGWHFVWSAFHLPDHPHFFVFLNLFFYLC